MTEHKPFRKLGENSKVADFYPTFSCQNCSKTFPGTYNINERGNGTFYVCSKCSNVLCIDFERPFFSAYRLDIDAYGYDEISRIILDNIKPCPCGGLFTTTAKSKCPVCYAELNDDMLLAYPSIAEFKSEAFLTSEIYEDYESVVKEKTLEDNLLYKHKVETALTFLTEGRLKLVPLDLRSRLTRKYLPLTTDRTYFANQWVIEKPKRSLFELYITKFFEPLKKGQDLTAYTVFQYGTAHIISSLGGEPFNIVPLHNLDTEYQQLRDVLENNKSEIAAMMKDFKEQNYFSYMERAQRLNLFDLCGDAIEHKQRNRMESEVPWRLKAEKEIQRWRTWWTENKENLTI